MEILCFLAGTVFAYTHSPYPLFFVAAALFLKAQYRIVLWFLAACLLAWVHQGLMADQGVPDALLLPQVKLLGKVSSLPGTRAGKVQFELLVTRLDDKPVNARILLSCYDHCPAFAPGQIWQMHAKLKRARNLGNPGHFDYQRQLLARHISWTGYLKRGTAILIKPSPHTWGLLSLRALLAERLQQAMPDQETLGIFEALTLGLTHHISAAQWDLFRRTGTTHLMVISGAHISLVAGLAYGFVYWLWALSSRLCLLRPASQAAALAGMLSALVYTLLAGFSVPAQRALTAFCLLLLRHFLTSKVTGWQAWRYALLLVLLMEPHAVLLAGFYLSFLAVAILIAVSQRLTFGGIKKNLALQLACLLGLMPATLYFFSYGAVDGFFANLIAIPLVGYAIVPLSFLALLVTAIVPVHGILWPGEWAVRGLFWYLNTVDQLSIWNLDWVSPGNAAVLALMLAGLMVVFLPLRAMIPVSLVLLVAALFPAFPHPKQGDAELAVLDVGQGLAVVIRTANHTLIYDTGMAFYQGGDMAKMAIIPYLTTQGITNLDKIVISHPDMDHRGGLTSLENRYPVGELIVDKPAFYHRGKACHLYPAWTWDGVRFRFLPIKEQYRDKNNSSCVLQVSNASGTVLLPGDIEFRAEQYLTATLAGSLAADVLVIPHHGSKTSSTPVFIQAVSPRYAIISAGFDNRYHFPHQQTLKTLQDNQVKIFNTMSCGMLTVRLRVGHVLEEPEPFSDCPVSPLY